MLKQYNENLKKVDTLTKEMLALADEGNRDSQDDTCSIIYAILRDYAYKLRQLVDIECVKHKEKGKWE